MKETGVWTWRRRTGQKTKVRPVGEEVHSASPILGRKEGQMVAANHG